MEETAMTPHTTHAKGFGQVLVTGMMLVAALLGSGCRARSSDRDAALWDQYIRVMDEALARGDVNAARMAREAAYSAALGSRRWDAMAAVGDASVRFMEFPAGGHAMRTEVRRIYRSALFRARHQGSAEGVLRVSEAFADLGDRDVAREGLTMAEEMLAASYRAHDAERLKALADRLDHPADIPEESTDGVRAPGAAAAAWTR